MQTGDNQPRAIIVISSHVARGAIGNRAAVLALETLGWPVWAVPTVVLPWHPGHGPGTRIVPPARDFAAMLDDMAGSRWLGEVGAILSGYLGEASQADAVANLVAAVKARNPRALYLCDPVMGDAGGLYVPDATARAIRDRLMPLADIATPNRHELAWLSGLGLDDLPATIDAALAAGPATMLVTSAPVAAHGATGNLLVTASQAMLADHRLIDRPPNGLGDLTAAVLLARILAGHALDKALQSTTATVFEILARTASRGGDELQIETDTASLSHPLAMVQLRHLVHPRGDRRA